MEISFISIRDLQTKLRDGPQFTQYADLQSPISEIKTENGSFTDPKEITNVSNEYFCNIGYNLAQNLESTSVQPSTYVDQRETEFKLDPVTEAEVYKYLSNVKPTKSTGYDKIPPKLIKDAAGVIIVDR